MLVLLLACYRRLTGVIIMSAAGVPFSLGKCILWPSQLALWLGLLLQTVPHPYWSVPEDKLQQLQQEVCGLMQQRQAPARQLARLAGLLVSVKEALPLPQLLASSIYLVLQGLQTWQDVLPLPDQLHSFMAWLQPRLQPGALNVNGNRWLKQPSPCCSCS